MKSSLLDLRVNTKKILNFFVPRSQKSQSQKKFRKAVAGEEQGGGKQAKKRRKNGGVEVLPEVSRVEVEEVGQVMGRGRRRCISIFHNLGKNTEIKKIKWRSYKYLP